MHTHMNEATYRRLALASCVGVLWSVGVVLPASAQPGSEHPPDPGPARAEAAALLSESLETAREQAGPMLVTNAKKAAQGALYDATSRAAELDLGGIPIRIRLRNPYCIQSGSFCVSPSASRHGRYARG